MIKEFLERLREKRETNKQIANRQKFIVKCPDCGEIVDYYVQSGICSHKPINQKDGK